MSDKVITYPGTNADVDWDERLCIHVGECGRADNELFVGGRKPWCEPDQVAPEVAAEVVARCPSGALTLRRKDGTPIETTPTENTVVVTQHGPLYVRGKLAIEGAPDDMPGVRTRAALCRCGHSKNKPFCDNSHEEAKFVDRGAVGVSGDGAKGAETLEVKPAPNGPLLLSGTFTIVAASGRVAFRGAKAALCRCGQSKKKPFCDGTHRTVGFQG